MKCPFFRFAKSALAASTLMWSGPLVCSQVLINELMYHPPPAVPEDVRKEWIELYNAGTNAVDLAGWRFTKGIQFAFTNVTLPAGGFLVVAANRAVFQTNYPSVANVVG